MRIRSFLLWGIIATVISLITCAAPSDVATTGTITGTVTNANGGGPLSGVQITTNPITTSVITNASGVYTLSSIQPYAYHITAVKNGYQNASVDVSVSAGQSVTANIQMSVFAGTLGVSPASLLDFSANSNALELTISNTASGTAINYTITKPSNVTWLTLSKSSGQVASTPDQVICSVSRSGLNPGNYTTKLTITSDGGNAEITVTMIVQIVTTPVIAFSDIFLALDSTDLAIGRYQGDTIPLNVVLKNIGASNALSVSCSLSTSDPYILINKSIGSYNNILKQDSVTNFTPYSIVISRSIPPAHPVKFSFYIKDSWGGEWTDMCTTILNPFIVDVQVVDDDTIPDSRGNGDHLAAPGEIVEFTPSLHNKSSMTIAGVRGILFSTATGVALLTSDDSWNYGDFTPDAKVLPYLDYVFNVGSTLKFYSDSIRFNLLARGTVNGVTRRWVVPVMVPVKTEIPSMPSITQITPGDGSATVSWNAVTGSTSYNLYYAAGAAVDKVTGTKITGVTSPKFVAGLTNSTQYAFAVCAVNSGGESGLSNIGTATPVPPIPTIPALSAAIAGDGSVSIGWSPVAGATSYNLYYTAGSAVTTSGTKVAGVTSPRVISGLINGTQYAFALSAVNAGGESGLSVIQTATPQPSIPSAPAISSAIAGDGSVSISWNPVAGATSYNLYYTAGSTVTASGTKVAGVTSPRVINGLTNSTQYAFAVSAVNTTGESGLSAVQTATPQPPIPSAPVISSAIAGDGSVSISWSPVAGATSYNLYYTAGSTVTISGTKVAGVTSPRVISGLTNSTQYAFAVSAVNAGGESGLSAVQTATPQPQIPSTPVISSAIAGYNTVTVSWNTVSDAISYNLYYTAGTTVTKSDTKITGVTSPKVVTGLIKETQYAFAVSAENATGESGLSKINTAKLVVPVPVDGMKLIPGGTFPMGQTGIAEPVHSVTLSSFYMDSTEVMQSDYFALRGVNPSSFSTVTRGPVDKITWFDAVLYCNNRSKRDGKDTVYSYTSATGLLENGCSALAGLEIKMSKNGYRLPTEAEWEYACRGGTTGTYYWGEATDFATVGLYAWYFTNSGTTTHSVAGKLPNAYGLYDMCGNVLEWNNDWYTNYDAGAVTDPMGPASGTVRGHRGGSWINDEMRLRPAYRDYGHPAYRGNDVGFRVVLPLR